MQQLFLNSQTTRLRDPEVETQGNRGVGFEVLIEFSKAIIRVIYTSENKRLK